MIKKKIMIFLKKNNYYEIKNDYDFIFMMVMITPSLLVCSIIQIIHYITKQIDN